MKKINLLKSLGLLGLASVFVACAGSGGVEIDKNTKYLNKSELMMVFSDKTLDGYSFKYKSDFDLHYMSDGTYKGTAANGKYSLEGVWHITDDGKKCETRKNRVEKCSKYVKQENMYYTVDKNNNVTSRFTSK